MATKLAHDLVVCAGHIVTCSEFSSWAYVGLMCFAMTTTAYGVMLCRALSGKIAAKDGLGVRSDSTVATGPLPETLAVTTTKGNQAFLYSEPCYEGLLNINEDGDGIILLATAISPNSKNLHDEQYEFHIKSAIIVAPKILIITSKRVFVREGVTVIPDMREFIRDLQLGTAQDIYIALMTPSARLQRVQNLSQTSAIYSRSVLQSTVDPTSSVEGSVSAPYLPLNECTRIETDDAALQNVKKECKKKKISKEQTTHG